MKFKSKDLYLLHVLRRRMEYPELKRAVCEQAQTFDATVVLIEDKASGAQLIQELVQEGLHAVTRYLPHLARTLALTLPDRLLNRWLICLRPAWPGGLRADGIALARSCKKQRCARSRAAALQRPDCGAG